MGRPKKGFCVYLSAGVENLLEWDGNCSGINRWLWCSCIQVQCRLERGGVEGEIWQGKSSEGGEGVLGGIFALDILHF
jgi:hypothetical protein